MGEKFKTKNLKETLEWIINICFNVKKEFLVKPPNLKFLNTLQSRLSRQEMVPRFVAEMGNGPTAGRARFLPRRLNSTMSRGKSSSGR